MCGINGIVDFSGKTAPEAEIRAMMRVMKHRGPDDEGVFLAGRTGLGFVRLSILDLSSSGHQPMFSHDGRYVLIFNGEIFNYVELREELKGKGHTFKSQADSEVLLAAYVEWGEQCLHRFNGMWAFVIYDQESGKLFAARDRYGIKPFYYFMDGRRFVFASEIPPILKVLNPAPSPNYQAIFDYLAFNRTDQTEDTFFAEIKKLQHGCCLKIEGEALEISKWYSLPEQVAAARPFEKPEEFRELFSSSVGLRLRSDVPVGVCLSGGLDSSSIVSTLLDDYRMDGLHTFSAVYENGQYGDESRYIMEYSPLLKNMFFTRPDAETLANDIENFVKAHGEPVPSTSPYAQFKVMELARQHVVVTLDGQGADEELAGYHYFFGFFFKGLLRQRRLGKLGNEMLHYLLKHHSLYGLKSFIYFLLPKRLRTGLRVAEKGYLHPDFVHQYQENNTIAGSLYAADSLNGALLDHFEYKLEHLLKWEDRNSMWYSLEARVPFLDYRLVERTLATSGEWIIRDGMTKHILREAMKGTLPEAIRQRRDKIGFGTPQDEWFRTPAFRRYILDIIGSEPFASHRIVDVKKVAEIYRRHLDRRGNYAREIWKWINLENWRRQFIG